MKRSCLNTRKTTKGAVPQSSCLNESQMCCWIIFLNNNNNKIKYGHGGLYLQYQLRERLGKEDNLRPRVRYHPW